LALSVTRKMELDEKIGNQDDREYRIVKSKKEGINRGKEKVDRSRPI